MTHNPQQYEHDIEEALNTLRAAQPAPGSIDEAFSAMNARLLRNVRTSAGHSKATHWQWLSLPRLAFAAAAVSAVWIGALLLPAFRDHPNQSAAVSILGAPSVTAVSSRVGFAGRQPSAYQSVQRGPSKLSHVGLSTASSIYGHGRPEFVPSQSTTIDPAFLPSKPAPEEPLTHQERLLQNIANRNRPMMLALLESHEPDFSTPRRPSGPSPLFAGFQPEQQSAPPADTSATQSEGITGPIPQP